MKPKTAIFCSTLLALSYLQDVGQAKMSPREIYRHFSSGVVLIVASPQGAASASAGTGSIIRGDGTIITNSHVIYNEKTKTPYQQISVFLKPKRVTGDMNQDLKHHYKAKVLGFDKALDLALLKIQNPPSDLTVLTLGDPDDLGPGDETLAIGHPEQGGLWTITSGVIGAQFDNFKGIPGKHVFQIDTSLNRGNSGGPLFDTRGLQVGVNASVAREGKGGVIITGVNFSIKSSVVKTWAAKYNLLFSYGSSHSLDERQPRIKVASGNSQPTGKPPRMLSNQENQERVFRDPESGGTIYLEENTNQRPDDVENSRTKPISSQTKQVTMKPLERKPFKFDKPYRFKPRPYRFRQLYKAVDRIKVRAQEAFDDLEEEISKRKRKRTFP